MGAHTKLELLQSLFDDEDQTDDTALKLCVLSSMRDEEFELLIRELVALNPRLWAEFAQQARSIQKQSADKRRIAPTEYIDVEKWLREQKPDPKSSAWRLAALHHLTDDNFFDVVEFVTECSEDTFKEILEYLQKRSSNVIPLRKP